MVISFGGLLTFAARRTRRSSNISILVLLSLSLSLSLSMSFSLPLSLNPSLPLKTHSLLQPLGSSSLTLKPPLSHPIYFKSLICPASSSSDSDREETRWLREEQRWLREEQRWLREEQRWARERESLLCDISDVKLRIQALERRISVQEASPSPYSVSDTISDISALLQALKDKNNLIAKNGLSSRLMVLEEKRDKEVEKEVLVEELVRVINGEQAKVEKRKTLRKGSEGDEVREMQVCFQ